MNCNHPYQPFSEESSGRKNKSLITEERKYSISIISQPRLPYELSDSSKQEENSTQVSWMDVWKQDSLGIKASQEHSRITRGMSWTDASWGCTAAEPGLLGINIASAVTQTPARQMLLCHTKPILKAVFTCYKCIKVLVVFSQRLNQQRAEPLLLCVFSCCYRN